MIEWVVGGLGLLALAQAESWLRDHWERCKARDYALAIAAAKERRARATHARGGLRVRLSEAELELAKLRKVVSFCELKQQATVDLEALEATRVYDTNRMLQALQADARGLSGANFGLGSQAAQLELNALGGAYLRDRYREDTGTMRYEPVAQNSRPFQAP